MQSRFGIFLDLWNSYKLETKPMLQQHDMPKMSKLACRSRNSHFSKYFSILYYFCLLFSTIVEYGDYFWSHFKRNNKKRQTLRICNTTIIRTYNRNSIYYLCVVVYNSTQCVKVKIYKMCEPSLSGLMKRIIIS